MKRLMVAVVLAVGVAAAASPGAQSGSTSANEPFKLGRFRLGSRTFSGLILQDHIVVDLAMADDAMASDRSPAGRKALPRDVMQLVARYDEPAVRERLHAIANAVARASGPGAAYVHDVGRVKVLPPVSPRIILNATLNYQEHAAELRKNIGVVPGVSAADVAPITTPPASMPGIWKRAEGDQRQNPYLFIKPTTAIVGQGDAIRIPVGRDHIDAECELTIVVGKVASRVPVDRAGEYIFGYTIENDVSDRQGRDDNRHGSDWLVAKSFDTFAPIGPYVVPKEFVKDPQQLAVKLMLNDKVMQNSNTGRMTHNVYELLSFSSNIVTLHPGDLIDTGSPAGVGASTGLFFKPGDTSICSIDAVGTLSNPVTAAR